MQVRSLPLIHLMNVIMTGGNGVVQPHTHPQAHFLVRHFHPLLSLLVAILLAGQSLCQVPQFLRFWVVVL